ncbi:MAG: sigma-70 family RNA polymerase sigma factor [Deltaproteobacteria bacterium]|nr:sigma-70 family RNA polymerase sigma factor [Deltaproteobacteria bacterium]
MGGRTKPRSETEPAPAALAALFEREQRGLWGLAYRLTGSAADAEDIVQEAFVRALERGPAPEDEGLRPWLVRVATNLALDALRRRKRRGYDGPWLPSPIEGDPSESELASAASSSPEARYGVLESASFAFLLALEALGPRQRAVLVLRDVLDYSARETADVVGTTEANVRILHHRARLALASYDAERTIPTEAHRERTRIALEEFLRCLAQQDARGLEALLADSVRTVTDAGGAYTALREPLAGRDRVSVFYLRAALLRQVAEPRIEVRVVNGLPAAVIELARPQRRQAPRTVLRCEIDPNGRIRELHSVLAPEKLGAVRFAGSSSDA